MTELICSQCGGSMEFVIGLAACKCMKCGYESSLFEATGLIQGVNKYNPTRKATILETKTDDQRINN